MWSRECRSLARGELRPLRDPAFFGEDEGSIEHSVPLLPDPRLGRTVEAWYRTGVPPVQAR